MQRIIHITLAWACILGAGSAQEIFLDVGRPEAREHLGYGWGGNERSGPTRFAWIKELEGDVWFDLMAAEDLEITIRAVPFFVEHRRQPVALYVNNRYVTEWVCPHRSEWNFNPYTAAVPAELLKPGRNRLTLRMGYHVRSKKRFHALAVESIRIRPVESEAEEGP